MEENNQNIFQREGDPRIYLKVKDQWYFYDPTREPLGSGAMGTVYLGYNCSTNERVAVKKIKDIYANIHMIRERARQEAALSFSHPNLVKMIGICEFAENYGPIFVISGYVPGITLETHVKEQLKYLSREERLEKIAHEICNVLDALHYLHTRGIVHRDVKPSNIMLENGSVVKLMDLGIARLNGGNKYSSYGFIGTPQYAAPEQILRDSKNSEINSMTDIYALGITFYELITGFNPYKTDVEAEILSRQITMKLPYDSQIPRSLFNVLQKATEKSPSKRYQSAKEFKEAIIRSFEKKSRHVFVEWFDRHKAISLGLVAVLLIITILLFIL